MSAPPRPQLDSLTAARGIAAWLVVLFHIRSGMPWLPADVLHVIHKGYLAVDFFFILSGFVIWLSAQGEFAARGLGATPAFLRRRLARIYPLYAVMLALTVGFVLLLEATGRSTAGYPWAELPLHVLMLQNWGFTPDLSWNHPAWSISTEFAAYLLFPLLVLLFSPIARAPRWVILGAMACLIGILAVGMQALGYTNLGGHIVKTGLARCIAEFAMGCLLCALWQQGVDRVSRTVAIVALLGGGFVWAGGFTNELIAFPLVTTALIYLIADHSQRGGKIARPLVYLGEISYATYLSHFMLFIWFKIALVNNAANIAPHLIALYVLLTLAASVILYHGIEKPGRRLAGRR
ncbi:acyltransferase family protein [Sphingobium fluviale]|uniref:Acyltransferase n=1 Tax=Sphingobium fluviale TaxID=2506423 RepID=A0A4Q1KH45_9SPHN|nr:acyltransferase [Sphingobium fluviale]RXR28832.1 acyltransferase [Sphingobium fluviale]